MEENLRSSVAPCWSVISVISVIAVISVASVIRREMPPPDRLAPRATPVPLPQSPL